MLYQRKRLSDMTDIGEPGPLPRVLQGSISDSDLANLDRCIPPELAAEYGGQGYFPYDPTADRWVHRSAFKRRFTAEERIAIKAAETDNNVPAEARARLADFRDILDSTERVFLDDLDVIAGLAFLVQLGLLASGRPAQIRA
jgi:hypothetical protein